MKVALSALAAGVTALASLFLPAAALADHHEMKVREIFPGSTANPGQDYVELQMYASGQRFVGGHTITIFGPTGTLAHTVTFPSDVANGAGQQTILAGAAASVVGTAPDHVDSGMTAIDPAGGAVCWNASPASFVDCVSWGSFPNNATLPDPQSSSAAAITDGKALRRTITAGCSTILEASDDTDSSGADFSEATPQPRNDSTTPTEVPCLSTTITKGPSGKTKDRTPTFKFKSSAPSATFECKVDHDDFTPCSSPATLPKVSFGKHKFQVRARVGESVDPTPASQRFKVVKRR
jgi:hypothetical protein